MGRRKILYWSVIVIILLLPLVSIGNNLGLYFDSIFPDYAATQILAPQEHQVRWFAAFPILCQVYHGSVSMWISLLAILLTGSTSVVQHHVVNSLVILVSLVLLDKIFEMHNVDKKIREISLFILAFMPTIMTFSLTQYYIELPGVVMILLATVLYIRGSNNYNNKKSYRYFFAAFFFIGLAFYNYFNFLFFFPGFLILYLCQGNNKKERFKNLFVGCYGLVCGAILYFCGFSMMFLNSINKSNYNFVCCLLLFIFVYAITFIVLSFLAKEKFKIPAIITGVCCLVGGIWCCVLWKSISGTVVSLDITGKTAGLGERLLIIGRNVYYAITGISAEYLIYGEQITKWQVVFLFFFVIITILYFIGWYLHKNEFLKSNEWKYLVILFAYLCCCIAFASRMQTQHFVPLTFWIFLITVLEISQLVKWSNYIAIGRKPIIICGYLLAIGFSALALINRFFVVDNILQTGGKGYYTRQINVMAEEAVEHARNGEKEMYIFPEWGFMSGFNYITNNNVAFSTNYDVDSLQGYMNEGYEIVLVYWKAEDTEQYLTKFEELNCSTIEQKQYSQNDGQPAFYKIEASVK